MASGNAMSYRRTEFESITLTRANTTRKAMHPLRLPPAIGK